MDSARKLFAIKAFHTVVWAVFAGCIVAIPFAVHLGRWREAAILIGIVFVEVLVILLNRGSCPLTPMAARHTPDRAPNFDIFLPVWLAHYNKAIFGSLYGCAVVYAAVSWVRAQGGA